MSQAGFNMRQASTVGGLLTADRITAWSSVLLIAEVLTLVFFIAGTHGMIVPLPKPVSTDFVSFYAAGRVAASSHPELVYDQAVHYAAEQAATAPGIAYVYFFYPPVFLLLCRALATLPYMVAFLTFQLAGGVTWLLSLRLVLRVPGYAWLLPCIAFPAVFWNVGLGQNAFVTASLFTFATYNVDRRPWLSGLLFGALCYKPHFGLLIPIALVAGRRWRTIMGAIASVVSLVLLSAVVFGWRAWVSFIHILLASRTTFEAGTITFIHIVTPFGAVKLAGASSLSAYLVQGLVSVCAAACVGLLWYRCSRPGPRNAALIAGTMLSIPVALTYDLLSAFVAAAWLVRDAMDQGHSQQNAKLLVLLFAAPTVGFAAGQVLSVQPGPFAMATLLILSIQRSLEPAVVTRQYPEQ